MAIEIALPVQSNRPFLKIWKLLGKVQTKEEQENSTLSRANFRG